MWLLIIGVASLIPLVLLLILIKEAITGGRSPRRTMPAATMPSATATTVRPAQAASAPAPTIPAPIAGATRVAEPFVANPQLVGKPREKRSATAGLFTKEERKALGL